MSKEQPEALWLADALDAINEHNADSLLALNVIRQAGPELRRLHAENEALRAQIGQGEPGELSDDDISDLAHSANEEALSFGIGHHLFLRYFKTVRNRALASTHPAPQQKPLTREQRDAAISVANRMLEHGAPMSWEEALIDAVEAAHNIGEKK